MAQQTAVDWFTRKIDSLNIVDDEITAIKLKQLYQQANKMFEQQINDAWKAGDGVFDEVADKLAKKYYNETYNKNI
jgi:hypothetical protein